MDMMTSFAPTMMCVHDAGYQAGIEHAQGFMTFGKFTVLGNFQSAIANLGDGALRISHYGYASNTAMLPGFPNALVQTSGDAIDLSYAQRIGKTTLGITLLPQDNSSISLTSGGVTVPGSSATDYGVRIGGMQQVTKRVRVGMDYSYQRDFASIQLPVPIVPTPTTINGTYLIRCGTIGGSWQVAPKTHTYIAYQSLLGAGPGLDRQANQTWCGVAQNITSTFTASANYFGGGKNIFLNWRTKYGLFNLAYTHDALSSAHDILGKGDSLFAGVDLAF
jgi:hypothetical protein